MFTVSVKTHFWASHQLVLPNGGKEPAHYHNWSVTADVSNDKLDDTGLVIDFHRLKAMLDDIVGGFNNGQLERIDYFRRHSPSAENLAEYVYEKLSMKLPKDLKLSGIRIVEADGCSVKFGK